MSQVVITQVELARLAKKVADQLQPLKLSSKIYGIPRGGVSAALAIISQSNGLQLVDSPEEADILIDDIIGSGATKVWWTQKFPSKYFFALIDKTTDPAYTNKWVVFPWEQGVELGVEANIVRIMQFIGEDPNREGLFETPKRVAKAWRHWSKGYQEDPADILKVFEDGSENYDEMVIVKDIPIYSKCEHHLADIFGEATIAYIPNGKIVGLSKLSRLADVFARRLQVQERLTAQIADALDYHLQPKGVGVIIKARHMCMESRGICQQGHHTITSALRGSLKEHSSARAEFMSLANSTTHI